MKKLALITALFMLAAVLAGCGMIAGEDQPENDPPAQQQTAPTQAGAADTEGAPLTIEMADGSRSSAEYYKGFYRLETDSPVRAEELVYLMDEPEQYTATLRLSLEGDAGNAIVLLVPRHTVHGDYQNAWENAVAIVNIEDFDADGLYGADGSFGMPYDFWNYEARVYDDRQAQAPREIAFVPLAAMGEIVVGELVVLESGRALKVKAITPDKTEFTADGAEDMTGVIDASGWGEEAWIGVVPSGVPHGDDERNDCYDESFEYLSVLNEGGFALFVPSTPGYYDLRVSDGDVEIAYLTFVIK